MNTELLRKVQQYILQEPRSFYMDTNVEFTGEYQTIFGQPCGTVCCIAGWVSVLSGISAATLNAMEQEGDRDNGDERTPIIAQALLQITTEEADSLFYVDSWPEPQQSQYRRARTPQRRAEVASARIDAFIAEHESPWVEGVPQERLMFGLVS